MLFNAIRKTGLRIPYPGTKQFELVEWKCPECKHRWFEYSDEAEDPESCPLCSNPKSIPISEDIKQEIQREAVKEYKDNRLQEEYDSCKEDIHSWLWGQKQSFFARFGLSKIEVFKNDALLEKIVDRYHKYVYDYSCDREWAVGVSCEEVFEEGGNG